jgi:hypothetical protein
MMDQSHFDQRIGGKTHAVIIDKTLQVAHQLNDGFRVLGRGVDGFTCAIFQCGAGQLAESGTVLLQFGLNFNDVPGGEQPTLAHPVKADPQGLAITQHLFGSRISETFGEEIVLKKFIMGGDDVFDGRTVLGFLHTEGIDENALVGNRGGNPLELGKFAAGQSQFFQNRGGLKPVGRELC